MDEYTPLEELNLTALKICTIIRMISFVIQTGIPD
ncbi:hypothetical protein [Blautia marasmi]|nr:hypothetical protein [Blautia marasmi]